ncbi:MAG: OmpA family protein [Flavobacteriaceae bacterium]|nr:OmpA family protein [Flavobacteriaceae bacterium]
MRTFLLFAVLFLSITSIKGQQLYFEAGKTISSFDYEDSQGESLDNLQSSNHTYLSLGYRKTIFTERLFLNLNGTYNGYGAIGSDVDFDNYFEWDLSYLGASVGFDYEIYKPGNFTFYLKASAAAEFLIQGTQTLNNQVYNLPGEEDFDTAIYFFRGGIGIQYKVSETLTVFNQYMYGTSGTFKDIQGDLKINTHNFGLGLLINISKDLTTKETIQNAEIEAIKKELEANSQKMKALEGTAERLKGLEESAREREREIAAKKEEIRLLKEAISNALIPYKGEDLTIEKQEDRVTIIMESDMLFHSGSWNISVEGEKAVNNLGEVLATNPNLTISVEGHTDNVPFKKSGNIRNNWDLSAKRATAIIDALRNNENINPKNLIAVGKGEYSPIADNETIDGRTKNRRIEIILTPQLKGLMKIIKE